MARRWTVEEYVEVIDRLERAHGHAHTNDIAAEMGIKPASVTEMVKKLSKKGLLNYVPYKGATLTKKGKGLARELTLKHRTLAEFLTLIGVDEPNAEKDACRIEHIVTQQTLEQLKGFIEFVRGSPHGPEWLTEYESETGKGRKGKKGGSRK